MKLSFGGAAERQPVALESSNEASKMRARLDTLKRFDPSNGAAFLKPVERSMTQAFEEKREQYAYGWMAVVAMMREEMMRDAWLSRQKKHSTQAVSEQEHGAVTGMYEGVLFHRREAPEEIVPHLPIRDLQRRLADVEANRKFYCLESLSAEQAVRAKQHLWSAFLLEVQEGKQAEMALIGILRYGLNYFRLRHPPQLSAASEGILFDPAVYVQGTMPREDIYHQGKFRDTDLIFLLPGYAEPIMLQLKTGHESQVTNRSLVYRLATVNLAASRLIECWTKIGEPSHVMSQAEFKHWKDLYQEVIEALTDEIAKVAAERAEHIQKFFLPWQRPQSAPKPKPEKFFIDQAFSLQEMNKRWSAILTLRPELEHEIGPMINLSNFTRAKQVLRAWYERESSLLLWQGWIKPHLPSQDRRAAAETSQA